MTEQQAVVLAFLIFIAWRERCHSKERATLLQRIQAPERAVAEHERRERPKLEGKKTRARVIAADNDEAMIAEIAARDRGEVSDGSD